MLDRRYEFPESFNKIKEKFLKAETAIKSAETTESEISLVPINQIRYGFKHFIDALECNEKGDLSGFDENISQTIGHCKRSFYDANDAEITYCIKQFNDFVKYCHDNGIAVNKLIPEHKENLLKIRNAIDFIRNDQHDIIDKQDRYLSIRIHLNNVFPIFRSLENYYELANEKLMAIEESVSNVDLDQIKTINQQLKSAKFANRMLVITVAVTLLVATLQFFGTMFDAQLKHIGTTLVPINNSAAKTQ